MSSDNANTQYVITTWPAEPLPVPKVPVCQVLDVQDGWIRVDWGEPDSRLEKLKPLPGGLYARETMDLDVLDEDELVGFVADYGVPGWWPWRALPHDEPDALSFANKGVYLPGDDFVYRNWTDRQILEYAELCLDQPFELPTREVPEPDWPFNREDDFRSHRETEWRRCCGLSEDENEVKGPSWRDLIYPPPPFTPDNYDEFLGQVHVSEVRLHLVHLRDMVRTWWFLLGRLDANTLAKEWETCWGTPQTSSTAAITLSAMLDAALVAYRVRADVRLIADAGKKTGLAFEDPNARTYEALSLQLWNDIAMGTEWAVCAFEGCQRLFPKSTSDATGWHRSRSDVRYCSNACRVAQNMRQYRRRQSKRRREP